MSTIQKTTITGVCIALCVVLPFAFHGIPSGGRIFCPIHIPVLICGLVCYWRYGMICGLLGPVISSLLTGMPAAAVLPPMMIECAVYGAVTGLIMQFVHTGRIYVDLYLGLITAMIAGRVLAGVSRALFFTSDINTVGYWMSIYFVSTLPGIVVQLVLLPMLVIALTRAKIIHERYPPAVG